MTNEEFQKPEGGEEVLLPQQHNSPPPSPPPPPPPQPQAVHTSDMLYSERVEQVEAEQDSPVVRETRSVQPATLGVPRGVKFEEMEDVEVVDGETPWPKPQNIPPPVVGAAPLRMSSPPPPPPPPLGVNTPSSLFPHANTKREGNYSAGGDLGLSDELSYINPTNRLAGFWVRVAYTLIDGIIISLVLTPILLIAGAPFFRDIAEMSQNSNTTSGAVQLPPSFGTFFLIMVLAFWITPILYALLFLGFTGSTLGQKILSVYVSTETGETSVKGQWGTVTLRTAMVVIFGAVPIISFLDPLWCVWDTKKQTLHDKVAKTLVVYKP